MIDLTIDTEIPITDKHLRIALYTAYNGKCFYTGRDIEIEDMHVDHIHPKSKGGRNCISNYVPTCALVNLSKSDMYDGKFVSVVSEIVRCVFAEKVLSIFINSTGNPANFVSAKKFFDDNKVLSSLNHNERQLLQKRMRDSIKNFITRDGGRWRYYNVSDLIDFISSQGYDI